MKRFKQRRQQNDMRSSWYEYRVIEAIEQPPPDMGGAYEEVGNDVPVTTGWVKEESE